jgi:hypothetical protein
VDLADVKWQDNRLIGKAKVIGGEPFKIVIALNGRQPVDSNLKLSADGKLAILTLVRSANETVDWSINFK